MSKYIKQINTPRRDALYNNILLLSRNKLFYTKFDLIDTFPKSNSSNFYTYFFYIY